MDPNQSEFVKIIDQNVSENIKLFKNTSFEWLGLYAKNKSVGYLYKYLLDQGSFSYLPSSIQVVLKNSYTVNKSLNTAYLAVIQALDRLVYLKNSAAYFDFDWFDLGFFYNNDIDLITTSKKVDLVVDILLQKGFEFANLVGEKVFRISKKEFIFKKITKNTLPPLIKHVHIGDNLYYLKVELIIDDFPEQSLQPLPATEFKNIYDFELNAYHVLKNKWFMLDRYLRLLLFLENDDYSMKKVRQNLRNTCDENIVFPILNRLIFLFPTRVAKLDVEVTDNYEKLFQYLKFGDEIFSIKQKFPEKYFFGIKIPGELKKKLEEYDEFFLSERRNKND